jgi:hypothetical protein
MSWGNPRVSCPLGYRFLFTLAKLNKRPVSSAHSYTAEPVEGVRVEPTAEFAQLQLSFVDQTQWRYEVIRPLVLFADRTAQQRAHETETHPDTVRTLRRCFHQQGTLGLLPADVEVVPRKRASPVPEVVTSILCCGPGEVVVANEVLVMYL